ncbi:MAG: helix-hairpin-helix domain-containing protein, partial [Prolixibacteraceae bacterium]|nr:helix-hairpin-helix domain-containing protein [Prolixibacteraceae bacterium]
MKKLFKNITLLLFASISLFSKAQENDPTRNLEAIIESLIENMDQETDVTLIVEDLEELAENPLNINSATDFELSKLHILNDIQIQKILNYRTEFGIVYSLFELNTIDGITPELLNKMAPFIWFGQTEQKPESFSNILKYGKHQLLLRSLGTTQIPQGYKAREDGTIPYEGGRQRIYTRYRFQSGEKVSVGLTAEKDPGEAFFSGSNKNGFNFYSGHVSLKINSLIQNVTVGDFLVRSGQGLVLWQGFSSGKSVYSMNISKTNQGVRPFTSTDENLFFRGVTTTLKFGNAKLSLFYSQKNVDANLAFSDSLDTYFTSLQTSGYHRTANEIIDEKALKQTNLGAVATWNFKNLKIGATFLNQHFEIPFIRSEQLYNKYLFSGKENFTVGTDYLFSQGKYQFFGEAAISKSKGKAILQGAIAHINDQLIFSALFRHFDKNYHALWANTFAEGSSTNNESGMYFGTRILPVKFVTLSAYSDFYRSEWINFTTAGPSKGWDIFTQADFNFSNKFQFYVRFKNEEKDQKFAQNEMYVNLPECIQKTRLHFQANPSETLTLKTRIEHVFYKGTEEE